MYGRKGLAYLHLSINIANQHQQHPLSFICKQGFDRRTIPANQHSHDSFKAESTRKYPQALF